jgi:polyhydroxybutyrate depolymerase
VIRAIAVSRRGCRLALPLATIALIATLAGFGGAAPATPSGGTPAAPSGATAAPPPAATPAGCSAARAGRPTAEFTLHLPSADGDRTARVRRSARASRGQAALIVALHGSGATGPFMERYSGLGRLADRAGFVVAFPSALEPRRVWNLDVDHPPDDVGFVAALIERVATVACIDPARVFAVGVSNGGGLAARVGCELSDRVAGIVVVAGGFRTLPGCHPSRPVSVLEIHGSDDRVVPYGGNPRDGRAGDVRTWLAGWAGRDRCGAPSSPRIVAPRTVRIDWRGCASGTRVAHLRVLGGGHQWPGATPPDPGPPSTLSAAWEAWAFLAPLRARTAAGSPEYGTRR